MDHDRADLIAMCIILFIGGIAIYLALASRVGLI